LSAEFKYNASVLLKHILNYQKVRLAQTASRMPRSWSRQKVHWNFLLHPMCYPKKQRTKNGKSLKEC